MDLSDFYDFMDLSNSRDVSHEQIVEWLNGLDLNSTEDELMLIATTHELATLWKQREIGMAVSYFLACIVAECDKLNEEEFNEIYSEHPDNVARFGISLINAVIVDKMGYTFEQITDILSDNDNFD